VYSFDDNEFGIFFDDVGGLYGMSVGGMLPSSFGAWRMCEIGLSIPFQTAGSRAADSDFPALLLTGGTGKDFEGIAGSDLLETRLTWLSSSRGDKGVVVSSWRGDPFFPGLGGVGGRLRGLDEALFTCLFRLNCPLVNESSKLAGFAVSILLDHVFRLRSTAVWGSFDLDLTIPARLSFLLSLMPLAIGSRVANIGSKLSPVAVFNCTSFGWSEAEAETLKSSS